MTWKLDENATNPKKNIVEPIDQSINLRAHNLRHWIYCVSVDVFVLVHSSELSVLSLDHFPFFVLFPLTNYFEMSVHTISYDYYGLLLLSLLLIIAIEYSLEMACLFQFTEFYFGQEMKYTPSMDGAMLYVNRWCNLCSNETHANFGIHHRHYKKIFLLKIKRYSRYSIWYHFMTIIGLSELQ